MSNKGSSWIRTVGSGRGCHVLEWWCDMFHVSWLPFKLIYCIFAKTRSGTHSHLVVDRCCLESVRKTAVAAVTVTVKPWDAVNASTNMKYRDKIWSEGLDYQIVWLKINGYSVFKALTVNIKTSLNCLELLGVFFNPTSFDESLLSPINTWCFQLSWLAGQDLVQSTHSTHLQNTRPQTGVCSAGRSCGNISRIWTAGLRSLNFKANKYKRDQSTMRLLTLNRMNILIPALVLWRRKTCMRESLVCVLLKVLTFC